MGHEGVEAVQLLVDLLLRQIRELGIEVRGASGCEGAVPGRRLRDCRGQAEAVAIGREFAMAYVDDTPEGRATQADAAVAFARRMPDVAGVQADTLGHRLTVTFRSGWVKGIVPIADGKNGAETPYLRGPRPQ